ncbi:hypothetical protein A5819_001722 [Enterococcus sp. 7E2_DIV0204]|uniref:Uncharacterized protein n=1 Tax=Candidatus Enterococcus lemimoniae TaxID=1834167 RepID=A0ABZ2T5K8_9ENTE|nr:MULTISPECIES: hypothetical protein [unclassified Enterococcus]OTN89230.1 hypothetical protein A5819_001722 [Enterococcus sp. 7E2_DIV0204]OTO68085.1 hypothetical protein A5866_000280 [Enterococcus sp. 12C11_DIV0727]OTP51678.1 hypothetical protein A5884_000873 [Enterococcus sp. 7D2_DIV0200]
MNTDERMLEVLQKTLVKIEELNTRLGHIESDLTSMDRHQTSMDHYAREIELATENNNIMG